jgi:conserved hypothetical nucleotide-binding protein
LTKVESNSHQDTFEAGIEYAKLLSPGNVVGLTGELGSGKTVFVKGICKYFNVDEDVISPTFILVNQYTGTIHPDKSPGEINHFDLYRIQSKEELGTIDIFSYVSQNSICLIEWPEIVMEILPQIRIVNFTHSGNENRRYIYY